MKVFLDTNVFLNILLAENNYVDCLKVLGKWRDSETVSEVVTSYLSFANIAYTIRKQLGKSAVVPVLKTTLNHISGLTDNTEGEYNLACYMNGPDFEDVLQYVNASVNGCDVIVTCNQRDFNKIGDPDQVLQGRGPEIVSPKGFLEMMKTVG
jgi:predicted nucleic acid-binding protein